MTHKIIVTIEVVVETDNGPDAIATTVLTSNLHDDANADPIAEEIDILRDRFEDDDETINQEAS